MIRKLFGKIAGFFIKMGDDQVNAHAASAAFFVFLSIFPILMLLFSILPYTPLTIENIYYIVNENVPEWANDFIILILDDVYHASSAFLPISIVMALWSSAKGLMALVTGFNCAEGVRETRNYFVLRFWCIIYTLFLMLLFFILATLIVFGKPLFDMIMTQYPSLRFIMELVLSFRWILVMLLMIFVFCVGYYFLPNKKYSSLLLKLPGALFASLGWVIFSWGFSIYVAHFGNFSMYGSLTTIVILLLWMYFCMFLLLMGGEINVVFHNKVALMVVKYRYRIKKKDRNKTGSTEDNSVEGEL